MSVIHFIKMMNTTLSRALDDVYIQVSEFKHHQDKSRWNSVSLSPAIITTQCEVSYEIRLSIESTNVKLLSENF